MIRWYNLEWRTTKEGEQRNKKNSQLKYRSKGYESLQFFPPVDNIKLREMNELFKSLPETFYMF